MTAHEQLLVADFNQCFEQMRHYEEAFLRRLEFAFSGIVAVIGAVAVLIEHSKATSSTYFFSGLLLSVSSIGGILLVWSLAKNRAYFAIVARYVNGIRAFYKTEPMEGLTDRTPIWTNHMHPKIFNLSSAQSIDIYLLTLCVSLLISGAVISFAAAADSAHGAIVAIRWKPGITSFFLSISAQVAVVAIYWYRFDKKTKTVQVNESDTKNVGRVSVVDSGDTATAPSD